jgi:tetratricopeptide (TPR) repeat protein
MILAKFLRTLAFHLNNYQRDASGAMKFLEKALALAKSYGDVNTECSVLVTIAQMELNAGHYMIAQSYACKGQHLANLPGDLYLGARALWIFGMCSGYFGNFPASTVHFQRAREFLGICGMSGSDLDYRITTSQAAVHLQKCEFAEARSIYTQIVKNTSIDHHFEGHAYALLNIAIIDVMIGATEQEVHQNLQTARLVFEKNKLPTEIICCDMILADFQFRERNNLAASTLFQKCLHLSWGKHNETVSYCLERLANVNRWNGREIHQKYKWPVVYLAFAQKSKEKLALQKALLFLGDVCVSDQNEDTAHTLFTVALEGFTNMDVHCGRAQCMQSLGDLANKRGDFAKASELWKAARPLFERSLQAKDVAQIDARLANAYQKALSYLTTLHTPIGQLQQLFIPAEAEGTEVLEDKFGEDVGGIALDV